VIIYGWLKNAVGWGESEEEKKERKEEKMKVEVKKEVKAEVRRRISSYPSISGNTVLHLREFRKIDHKGRARRSDVRLSGRFRAD